MIVFITGRFKSTKIQRPACFCFRIRRPRWSSFDTCVLELSRSCVFQGGIKMHDRNIWRCRLLQTNESQSRWSGFLEGLYGILVLGAIHENVDSSAVRSTPLGWSASL